ncbi:hypothetical protein K469DRAFT_753763 [Zopfia rhizophila CBS 207.26]|uniref:F-box domain-containing protein n=1 Tax=Zopfia rhizophila CBS 207.26 TaxID=1314779 RepID=A0A6A6DL89_9PEZI|nr:hypothetical protein K469DRAFT_753763 [Zopfia rhizophila CBS 207.26]
MQQSESRTARGILSLPNEILHRFLDSLDTKDVASLSASCRRLHHVTQSRLYKCIAWNADEGGFSNTVSWDLADTDFITRETEEKAKNPPVDILLRTLARNADLASRIQELSFQGPRKLQPPPDSLWNLKGTSDNRRLTNEDIEKIKQSSRLGIFQEKEARWTALENGDRAEITLLAVLFCPNLRRLRISYLSDDYKIGPFVSTLIDPELAPFLHMEYLHLGELISGQHASRLVQLPNLKGLEIGIESSQDFIWPALPPSCAPHLTTLDLFVDHWEPGMLSNILSTTPCLKELRYHFAPWVDGEQSYGPRHRLLYLDLRAFHLALQSVKGHLEKLGMHVFFCNKTAVDVGWGTSGAWTTLLAPSVPSQL